MPVDKQKTDISNDDDDEDDIVGSVLFVKNLNFDTTDDLLKEVNYVTMNGNV